MQYTQELSICHPPDGGDMTRSYWLCAVACLCVVLLGLGTGQADPPAYILRFSDTLPTPTATVIQPAPPAVLPGSEPEVPAVPANDWLTRQGWKQVWPLRLLGAGKSL